METGGEATCYRYSLSKGGWNVGDRHNDVLEELLTGYAGFDGCIVNWKHSVVVSQLSFVML